MATIAELRKQVQGLMEQADKHAPQAVYLITESTSQEEIAAMENSSPNAFFIKLVGLKPNRNNGSNWALSTPPS